MKCQSARGRLFALASVMVILLADFCSKRWAINSLLNSPEWRNGVFGLIRFRFAWNTGVAFSFLSDKPLLVAVFTLLVLTAVALVLFLPKKMRPADRLCLSFIFAGGFGNLIDRLLYGAVVDFIEITFISFPVFNLADVFVVTGTVLFALNVLILDRKKG